MRVLKMRRIVFMHPFYVRWLKSIFGRRGIFILVFFLAATFAGSLIYKICCKEPFVEALTAVLPYFLGEFGDLKNEDTIDKAISLFLFVLGTVVVATLIGKLSSIFVGLTMGVKMPDKLKNHIIICNWNEYCDRIIKEIHSPLARPQTDIMVITEKDVNEEQLRSSPEYKNVYFFKSDPTEHDVLKKAQAHLADSVIILADNKSANPDVKTAWITLAITHLGEKANSTPRIVVEVKDHRNLQHLKDAGANELICPTEYGLGIIAQCASKAKLSEVYERLLKTSKETNEIYFVSSELYHRSVKGKSFKQVSEALNEARNADNPTILIGIKRDDDIKLNPKEKKFQTITDDDTLIVMAFEQPDLRHLEIK